MQRVDPERSGCHIAGKLTMHKAVHGRSAENLVIWPLTRGEYGAFNLVCIAADEDVGVLQPRTLCSCPVFNPFHTSLGLLLLKPPAKVKQCTSEKGPKRRKTHQSVPLPSALLRWTSLSPNWSTTTWITWSSLKKLNLSVNLRWKEIMGGTLRQHTLTSPKELVYSPPCGWSWPPQESSGRPSQLSLSSGSPMCRPKGENSWILDSPQS